MQIPRKFQHGIVAMTRVGWLVVPKALVRPIERLAQNLYISKPGKPDIAVTSEKNQDIRHGEAARPMDLGA